MTGIPERVRDLIRASGVSQRDIAAEIGLDATKLSKSLTGARRFSSLDLARVADRFDVTVDWLITGEEPALAVAARSTGGSAQVAARRAAELSQMRADLASLGYGQRWQEVGFRPGGRWTEEGDRLARAALQLVAAAGRTPTEEALAGLIEDVFGVDVAVAELGEQFDGLAARSDVARLMVVNTSPVTGRQRFTMAHELAHLLLGDDQDVRLDADIFDPAGRQDASEVRANAFAASFLMPEPLLRVRIEGASTTEEVAALAYRMRVTPLALSYRLQALRLVDAGQATALGRISELRAASLAGLQEDHARRLLSANQVRPPGLLVRDAFSAYTDGQTTLRPYARLIGVDPDDLRRRLESAEEGLPGGDGD